MPFDQGVKSSGNVVATTKNMYLIACASGEIYRIKRPGGRLATNHFTLMTKAVPTNITWEDDYAPVYTDEGDPVFKRDENDNIMYDDDGEPIIKTKKIRVPHLSEGDLDRLSEAFQAWAPSVLPSIIKEGLPYDEMPGEDQYGIFMALFNKMNMDKEIFRFVDDGDVGGQGTGVQPAAVDQNSSAPSI